jgi:hypothetical protein
VLADAALDQRGYLVAAVALALLSTGCYATSAVLQQREAGRSGLGGWRLVARLVRRPPWLLAVLATGAGAALHLFALALGPLGLVQPIGVLTLVWALPLGAVLAKRVVTGPEWRAAAVACVGVGLALAVLPRTGGSAHLTAPVLLAALVVIVALAVVLSGTGWLLGGFASPVLSASAAASCEAFASAMARVAFSGAGPFLLAGAIALGVGGFGLALAQTAYRSGGLGAPLAILILLDPLVAVGIGVTLLGEPVQLTPLTAVLGLAGVAATVVGIAQLARHRPVPATEPARR